jgi:hypothetical protein
LYLLHLRGKMTGWGEEQVSGQSLLGVILAVWLAGEEEFQYFAFRVAGGFVCGDFRGVNCVQQK